MRTEPSELTEVYDQMVRFAVIRKHKGEIKSIRKELDRLIPIDLPFTEVGADQDRFIGGNKNG